MTLLQIYTLFHVIISVTGIVSGLVVLIGLLGGKRLDGWTKWFLITTAATSVTGFFFPAHKFMPSHGVGILSLVLLAAAVYARYFRSLARGWRKVYVIAAVMALYLNVFVAVVQTFLKIPALQESAPTQTEPPFRVTQLVVLAVFVLLGIAAAVRFRDESGRGVRPLV